MPAHIVSDASTHALSTAWTAIPVGPSDYDPDAAARPGNVTFVGVECDLSDVDTASELTFALTYDAGGTQHLTGESAPTLIANVTGTVGGCGRALEAIPTWPGNASVGELVVWIKADAGTPVVRARGVRLAYK